MASLNAVKMSSKLLCHQNGTFLLIAPRMFSTTLVHHKAEKAKKKDILLVKTVNGVTTMTMNDPKKLNGWTKDMMLAMQDTFTAVAKDDNVKVAIVTGADPYYCAGVNLSDTIRPMHPKTLHEMIRTNNQAVFDNFIEFPKPIICAANGPAIGASVTTATLCDLIVASPKATFATPFARLGIPPEGCSSVHFERIMGAKNAERMLGKEGWVPTAEEANKAGFVGEVVEHEKLLARAQEIAEQWIKDGKKRWLVEENKVAEYKAVNAQESADLADAFLSYKFLNAQYEFLKSKNKAGPARAFWAIKTLRPLWSKML